MKRTEKEAARAELARRELARRHYGEYLAYVHGNGWKRTRMSAFLAERLQEFMEKKTGSAYDILIIHTPPQHGKTLTVTESLPCWYLGKNPRRNVILASYNDVTAQRFCRRNREKVQRFGRCIFGVGTGSINRANEFELENGAGRLISRGIMSGITGNPADLLIIDDPIKNRQEADSLTYRSRLWEEWQNSLKSRLAAGAKVVLIMTPWHEDDLAARILASEKNVTLLRLPVEAEENDPLGRKPGEPLCPELGKDAAWLSQFRASYVSDPAGGARAWQALYMCSPRAEDGNLVRREWWKRFRLGAEVGFHEQLISVDAAFKGGETSDYVAITVWGRRGSDYFLLYCLNRQLDFPRTLAAIRTVRGLFPTAGRILVEDKANGSAIVSVLGRELTGVIPVQPKGGKVARVNAVSPAIESGHVFVPEGESWAEEFLDQWTAFPAAAHDDMVDSASQALAYMLQSPAGNVVSQSDEMGEAFGGGLYDVYG
ncbi:MAG: phage terminase large subunit [Oscillospiraceae bacterium]|nr:phage terminase large subunit [Oscillospiraceae bacterium]